LCFISAEEIVTKLASKLVATIDEAHKWLKKMDSHSIKEEGMFSAYTGFCAQ